MKQLNLVTEDINILEQSKREELEDEFYDWLQSHFDPIDIKYLNMVVDVIDDATFFSIAEIWANEHMKNKIYY